MEPPLRTITTITACVCLVLASVMILHISTVQAEDVELTPTSDVTVGFDTVYPADGVHYTKVDDGASHDSATTYCRAESNGDKDIYGLEDMSEPSGSYDLDVTIYVVSQDTGTGNAFFDAGVVISSTEYVGVNDQQAPNSWTTYDYTWEENPAGGEWTYTAINGMNVYVDVYDAAPDVDVTSVYIIVTITYNAQWAPTFTSSPDTTATEDEAYSYTATCNETVTWGAGMTSNATWLTWTQANHTVWGTPGAEDVGSFYVNITATSDAGGLVGYQNYTVTVEEKPSATWAPTFTSSPDTTAVEDEPYSYEATCNESVTWGAAMTSNATWLTWTQANHTVWGTPDETDIGSYYVNITATSDAGTLEGYQNYTVTVEAAPLTWAPTFTSEPGLSVEELSHYTYTATCNESVSWPEAITTNATWLTWTQANHTVWGTPANEDIGSYYINITATSVAGTLEGYQNYTLEVTAIPPNEPPTITSTPSASSHNNTLYYYNAEATDPEEDELTWDLEGNITDFASITPSTGVVQGTPTAIGDYWMNVSVTDGTSIIWQNTSVHIYTDAPSFVTSAITTWQNGTTYLYNAQASDPEAEGLTFHLEGNGTSFVGITPAGYYCEIEGAITEMGWWYLNLSVTDGTNTVWQNWTLTALNTAPTFTNTPVTEGLVNVSYSWAPNATDLNSDTLIYSIDASPDETKAWLSYNVSSGYLEGIPTENGTYMVNLSVTDAVGATTWLNFSLTIDLDDTETISVLALIIGLVFCIALLALGLRDKTFWLAAGPVWIFCGIAIFMDYGDAFMLMSVGLGLVLLIRGAYDVWA